MDIDTEGDDVIALRKKAIELLLSEHRAECEAPCRVVCPAGYNIPLMNRLLSGGKIMERNRASLVQTGPEAAKCINCAAYCENACRRKKSRYSGLNPKPATLCLHRPGEGMNKKATDDKTETEDQADNSSEDPGKRIVHVAYRKAGCIRINGMDQGMQ